MSDIEVVIKMPEDVFKRTVFYREFRDLNDYVAIIKALEKATPLSKGHGRLIDVNGIREIELDDGLHSICHVNGDGVSCWIDAPTIIEADKESEET